MRFWTNFAFVGIIGCAVAALVWTGCTSPKQEAKVVNLAIWGNYLPEETQNNFTKKTGIKINITNYSSNEELLAKVQAGASGIDVAVPSDYMVNILAKQSLLTALDTSKITQLKDISEDLLNQDFDPGNKYSVPYAWSTAGIAYNKELFPNGIKDWKTFFSDSALAGKVSLLDDVREVMAVGLKTTGASVNSKNDSDIQKAKEFLKANKKKIKMFRSDTIEALLNKEVIAAHTYSVDANQAAARSGGKIVYVIPAEGGTRSIDNLVILKGSQHVEASLELINYLLTSEVNVDFVNRIQAGPVLKSTKAKLPAELQTKAALFPDSNTLSKLERLVDLGEKTEVYDKAWTEIKSE